MKATVLIFLEMQAFIVMELQVRLAVAQIINVARQEIWL
ncbi:hypothetical protein CPter91_1935 [Collimonas pratensis]|uniref:Uncharacterized protein n=1 Tax=Collimonas pratensis TaxID=279113 RepID=A0A127Q2S2_9BURK|nr:hypothetical protein CPter91_1935 [Collimonas pratensis]